MEMSLGYKFFYDDHNTFSHFSWSRRKLKEQAKGDERCVDYICAQVQAYHRFPSPRFKLIMTWEKLVSILFKD